jgi:futalosine hydrolase
MSFKQRKVLVVAATEMELPKSDFPNAERLITGVSMVATSTYLTKQLMKEKVDLVVNVGIAGAFSPELKTGTVVQVVSDRLVELGVEDRDRFVPADEIELCETNDLLFSTDERVDGLEEARGITVNRVHGEAKSIEKVREQFNPDVESMEGAAVGFVCSKFEIPWVQIRAISNLVEPRNRDNWDIPLALENLHHTVEVYLKQLCNEG